MGNALDQAASTLMVAAEAEENTEFLTQVETLYSSLYNKTTLDLETSDWVWGEKVDWDQVKSRLEVILPTLDTVSQRACIVTTL